jgi:hypothetical protein
MSDRFDDELRQHLHREAEEIREFPRRLRGRIREGIAPRRSAGFMPQLALAGALLLVALVVLAVRSPQVVLNDVRSTVTHLFESPTPTPTSQPFICSDRSGGTTGLSAQLTGIRSAHHSESPGYDRMVFDFNGGIPSYDLTRQESPAFVKDPSGQPIALEGGAGIKLTFRDTDPQGVSDQSPQLPAVRQVAQLGNFERVLSYGVGLSNSQCVRVLELSNPSRLVVDVMTATSASTTPAPTPVPTTPQATDLGPFACTDASGGSNTGPAMRLTDVRVAHQAAGYDRIVFQFAPPAGATAHIPAYTVTRQASTKFIKDPSGMEVTLQGSSGLRIVFHGASGADSYTGSRDLTPNLPVLKELEQIGDFEAVLSWGAGMSRPSCLRTLELANPTRLVIDIQTP